MPHSSSPRASTTTRRRTRSTLEYPTSKRWRLVLRACLQEGEELPRNFAKLFNDALFRFDTDAIPEVVALYEQLNVKHEPLSLIPPTFECPLPPLLPATFPLR